MNRGTDRHGFVGVDVPSRLLAKKVLDFLLHFRHTRLPADENDIVDIGNLQPGIRERRFARRNGSFEQLLDQRLDLRAAQVDIEMLGTVGVSRNVGQVHLRLLPR